MEIFSVGTVRTSRLSGCTLKYDIDIKKSARGVYDTKIDSQQNCSYKMV